MTADAQVDRDLARARAIARGLDNAVRVPGTEIRVGFDPVLGLVPGVGDIVGGALAGYLVFLAARHGAPKSVLLRMTSNLALDSLVGTVPLLGDLFDVGWKANARNLALLEQHLARPAATRRSSRLFVAAVIGALVLLLVGAVYIGVAVVRLLIGLFQ
jgi:hypothetical protein